LFAEAILSIGTGADRTEFFIDRKWPLSYTFSA